jgi:hypothetical protein
MVHVASKVSSRSQQKMHCIRQAELDNTAAPDLFGDAWLALEIDVQVQVG